MTSRLVKGICFAVCIFFVVEVAVGQSSTAQVPNSDPVYQQLRKIGIGSEAITVNNTVLKRDAGTFTFASGTICFLAPVQGKVTGAVFMGTGSFALTPPVDAERRQLSLLTGNQPFKEEFSELVLRFSDGTYDELKKAGGVTPGGGTCPASMTSDNAGALQHTLHYNVSGRLLQDVLSDTPGGLFMAFVKGKKYNGKMLYTIDTHGAPALPADAWESRLPTIDVYPEEVSLITYDENKFGIWSAFRLANAKAGSGQENGWIDIEKHELDATLERGGKLNGKATTSFVSRANGLRVVNFELFPTLRVQAVTDASGQPLPFIQEDKSDDPQFFVILPKALAAGERFAVTTTYAGKDAISNEGDGNYYVSGGARSTWYPNSRFEDYAMFDMRFAVPKGLTMVATGEPVGKEIVEGNQSLSRWRSEQPQTVACFQFGRFKKLEAKIAKLDFTVEAYANTETPSIVKDLQHQIEQAEREGYKTMTTLGSISTTGMNATALAEGQLAIPLFTDYFGPLPFKRIALTQQTAVGYGQSWPELVWLPMSYFWDTTIRHQLGMDDPKGYFKAVASHEIAHQWWGHTVTWASYRDQWMSEGFAQMSASLYLQMTRPPKEYIQFWNDLREQLLERNKEGFRAIDVGPVTMGYRASTSKAGEDVTQRLIYPKGGYILHMIRMMMWDPKTGDENFKAMMKDFVKTYTNRPASTEDFKAMVEKHMVREMNLTGNGRMDWFFNEYVYGTLLPHYRLEHSIGQGANGAELSFKITQSGVHSDFRMAVPLYLELANGKVIRLGSASIAGNTSVENKVPLGAMKELPKRAILNYYDDVLAVMDN